MFRHLGSGEPGSKAACQVAGPSEPTGPSAAHQDTKTPCGLLFGGRESLIFVASLSSL